MEFNLQDKLKMQCIITGANGGIGKCLVERLRHHFEIIAIVRQPAKFPDDVIVVICDLSNPSAVEDLHIDMSRVKIVINNAAVAPNMLDSGSNNELDQSIFQVNVLSPMILLRKCEQSLITNRGRVINVSSMAVDDPFNGFRCYAASKSALESISRSIERETNESVLAFNLVLGCVETKMLRAFADYNIVPTDLALDPDTVALECQACALGQRDKGPHRITMTLEPKKKVTLTRLCTFSSSHKLWRDDLNNEENRKCYGKCTNLHGHNYRLEVSVTGCINENGFVLDTRELQSIIDEQVINCFDHNHLNDVMTNIPTTENLSIEIHRRIKNCLSNYTVGIKLYETDRICVTISG